MTISTGTSPSLALNGGQPAVRGPLPSMYPGGMRIGKEEEAAVVDVIRSRRLFRYYGPGEGESKVAALEAAVCAKLGAGYTLAVSSGTMALAAGLAALGVGPGDEVIVPAYTWIATPAAVLQVGAVPVIAEVDAALNLDAQDAERRITPRTRALLPVHMRGAPSNMDDLLGVASRRGVAVIEDVAQACGASYHRRRLGAIGDIGAFSLQFNKIVTSGEGGLVTTSDRGLYERALMFHDLAASRRASLNEDEAFLGTTCRLSELQGAVALAQFSKLDEILADMRQRHSTIRTRVATTATQHGVTWRHQWDPEGDAGLALVAYLPDAATAHYIVTALRAEGLPASVMFDPEKVDFHVAAHWGPLLAQRSWSVTTPWELGDGHPPIDPTTCPRTHDLLGRAVNIDVSPDLTETQTDQVTAAIDKVFSSLPLR